MQRERARTLVEMAEKCLFAYREPQGYDAKSAAKHLVAGSAPLLRALRERLDGLVHWRAEDLDAAVRDTAQAADAKLALIAQPLRVALTGAAASPPIDQTLMLVGRERTLARIDRALEHLRAAEQADGS